MILAIDIGNTYIVVGCIRDEEIVFAERLHTDGTKSELEYAISIKTVLELYGIDRTKLDGGILSSVVPPLTNVIRRAAEKVTGREVLVVGPGVKTGLDIRIDNPAQLGPDLVVEAAAAAEEYPCPLVIVDMGTATTFTVVNEKKQVLGGMIMPGVNVALDSLISRTSQLPKISLEPPEKLIASNTVDCMKSGVLFGNAACVDGVLARIQEEFEVPLTAVATGGMAKYILPYCRTKIEMDDGLILKGLKLIYRRNSL